MPSFARELEQTLHNALAEASGRRHEYATLEHLLLALIEDVHAGRVMEACGVNTGELRDAVRHYLDNELEALKVEADTDPSPTSGFQRVVQRAILHVQSSGRDEVTGANVLVALFSERESYAVYFLQQQDMSRLDAVTYISHGVGKGETSTQPTEVKGTEETKLEEGKKKPEIRPQAIHRQPQREGRGRPRRSADRPRAGGRPHRPDPLPPLEEQSALCGRSRRRQDRDRGGPRPQHRRRQRSRGAEARGDLFARHGLAAGGHPLSRRFRGAAESRGQRAREAPPRHSLHRRDPYRDWRRRHFGRGDGRVQSPEAGALLGHDPVHRLDHLQGIPQPFREGPGPAPALPEDRHQRADRRGHDQDPRRPALGLRAASLGQIYARRDQGRGRAQRPLHQRPQAAGQGDRRDRRGRRDADAGRALEAQEDDHRERDRGGDFDHRPDPGEERFFATTSARSSISTRT